MVKYWCERKSGLNVDKFDKEGLFTFLERTNTNILITGPGGTGKSTILKKFKEKTKKNCVILSPTGIAANNVGGQTIHSFFKLDIGVQTPETMNKERWSPLYEKIDLIIIDEISMVRKDVFEYMDKIMRKYKDSAKPFGGVKLILFGDLYQLPPVITMEAKNHLRNIYDNDLNYFFDSEIYSKLDLLILNLNEIYRQKEDKPYAKLLDKMRRNEIDNEDLDILNQNVTSNEPDKEPILSTKNDLVESYNRKKLSSLPGDIKIYDSKVVPPPWLKYNFVLKKYCNAEEKLELKIGARIMVLINDAGENKRYFNGSLGTVKELCESHVLVNLDSGKEISFEMHNWDIKSYKLSGNELEEKVSGKISQIPLKLAWAMTIHKSQGQTLEKAFIDLSYSPWESGHSYVAFSRIESLKGIKLKIPLKKEDIIVDQRIIEWENALKKDGLLAQYETQEMNISGLDYSNSKDFIEKVNNELLKDWSIEKNMVSWKSQTCLLISKDPLFSQFIQLRIKDLLKEIVQEEKTTIFINLGCWNEERFIYKRGEKEKMDEILNLFKK
ncbi:MAG: AAA family ATPase [Nanoarchaeota archaeon]|nr:AAA family ATPase [Nanoarchaeota archaeon]MBU4116804.1 AAA family ATPase [Nanoarchaeota archaeon]